MKKVGDYRKILGVTKASELKEIKSIYRGLMKDWHPDKFSESAESQLAAEEKSKEIIEAYTLSLLKLWNILKTNISKQQLYRTYKISNIKTKC
jgi:preprotein translocase subunit Sec63